MIINKKMWIRFKFQPDMLKNPKLGAHRNVSEYTIETYHLDEWNIARTND